MPMTSASEACEFTIPGLPPRCEFAGPPDRARFEKRSTAMGIRYAPRAFGQSNLHHGATINSTRPNRRLWSLEVQERERARMQQQISVVTLGIADLARSRRFYADGFGWKPV